MENIDNLLKSNYKNFTQGKKHITSFINKQEMNIPFINKKLMSLMTYHPTKPLKDIEYFVIRRRKPIIQKHYI